MNYEELSDQEICDLIIKRLGFFLFQEIDESNRQTAIALLTIFDEEVGDG